MSAGEAATAGQGLAPDARIDAHVHLWRAAPEAARVRPQFPGDDRSFLPEHLGPILERSRFDAALVVSCGNTEAERFELATWVAEHAFLWGLVAGWSDDLPESRALAALHQQGKLRGIWVRWPGASPGSLVDCHAALAFCEAQGLALELMPGDELPDWAAAATLARDASVPVVLSGFAGVPGGNQAVSAWMDAVGKLAANPQVFVKLNGFFTQPTRDWPVATVGALIQFLLDALGAERLLFGSGWPFCLPAHSWKECLARFTQALGAREQSVREHLLGATGQRAYERPVPNSGTDQVPTWKC